MAGNELSKLASELQAIGDGALLKEAERTIRRVGEGAVAQVQLNAMRVLPKRGGANTWVANAPVRRIPLLDEKRAGLLIRQTKRGHDLIAINRGLLRHPLFGNREHWYTTNIPRDYFDAPIRAKAPEIERRLTSAIERLIAKGKAA